MSNLPMGAWARALMSVLVLASLSAILLNLLVCLLAIAGDESSDGRVQVVFVFDESCRISCDAVRPIFSQLKVEYGETVKFVALDVSREVLRESRKAGRELRAGRFPDDMEDWYRAFGVVTGGRKKIREILGAKPKEQYVQAIEKAFLAQQKDGTTDKGKKVSQQ